MDRRGRKENNRTTRKIPKSTLNEDHKIKTTDQLPSEIEAPRRAVRLIDEANSSRS